MSKHKEKHEPEKEAVPLSQEPQVKTLPLLEYETMCARLKELEGVREKLLLSAADFENAKKRLTKEKEEYLKYAQENLLRDILPALDNLERALAHRSDDQENLKNVVKGVEMVSKNLLEILKRQGLQRFVSKGEILDPHRHEAVAYLEEEGRENEIVDEIEAGYLLYDRVFRAAKVRVRVAPPLKEAGSST